MPFSDRTDAGSRLGTLLAARPSARDGPRGTVVVLGLPRGGVPVAAEVATALHAPLDVLMVRKLGVPAQPELAFGAVGENGVRVLNDEVVRSARLSPREIEDIEASERGELSRRLRSYREGRAATPLRDKTALIVDDGVATGATARAACLIARAEGAARVVVAVPVAPQEWTQRLGDVADELVCVDSPAQFLAVGQFYDDFSPTTDGEVREVLRAAAEPEADGPALDDPLDDPEVVFNAAGGQLTGELVTPADPRGVVLFAHGSGSSRHSPRNRHVAATLNQAGLATFLFDLLTPEEAADRGNVFDVALLAERLRGATEWAQDWLADLPVGYFGASTGAAAALSAAAAPDCPVQAVVSRGGRPDLAGGSLPEVRAPTLLIVGGSDDMVLDLNRSAQSQLTCENRLDVIPGATHLFEEPGTLDRVAQLASRWFVAHLRVPA